MKKPIITGILFTVISVIALQPSGGIVNAGWLRSDELPPPHLESFLAQESDIKGAAGRGFSAPEAASAMSSAFLDAGDSYVHGLIYYDGFLWATTRTLPARVIKINPSTLAVDNQVILPTGYDEGEDILAANGYLWVILYTDPARLMRIDPVTLAATTALAFPGGDLRFGVSLEYAFGYLWAGGLDAIAQIDISDPDNLSYQVHDYAFLATADRVLPHALASSGEHLWIAFYQYDNSTTSYFADTYVRADPLDPTGSYLSLTVSALFPDDMAFQVGELYACSEAVTYADMYQFAADLSGYLTQHISDNPSYGVFANPFDATAVWGAFVGTPGVVIRMDRNLTTQNTLSLPTGYNDASEIAYDDLGNMYISTWQDPSGIVKITAPAAISNLTISRSGSDALLNWTHADANVTHYMVWRGTTPYFMPGEAGVVQLPDVTPTGGSASTTDSGSIGNPANNYYYLVQAVNSDGLVSPVSNRVGVFNYELRETAGLDFNWIALPLNASLSMASDLEQHIESNASGTVTVAAIEYWNAGSQNYQSYTTIPVPSGDFALTIGGVYRVSVDVTTGSTVVWSLPGGVPAATAFSYDLYETAGSDFTWLMLPLDKGAISMASDLKIDLDTNATPQLTTQAVEWWNTVSQNYQTYTTFPLPQGDFATRIGYPYRVAIDIASGSVSTWP